MYCPSCGKEIEDGSKVCAFCGEEVLSDEKKPLVSEKPKKQSEMPKNPTILLQGQVQLLSEINRNLNQLNKLQQMQLEEIREMKEEQMEFYSLPASVWVSNFDMPLGSMVTFMLKWIFASIPVGIIVFILLVLLQMLIGGGILGLLLGLR